MGSMTSIDHASTPNASASLAQAPEPADALVAARATAARAASRELAALRRQDKDAALLAIGDALVAQQERVLAANAQDLARGEANGTSASMLDRLRLSPERIEGLRSALAELAALPDPIGELVRGQTLPNGLRLRQVRVPLGVVGVIYEARPNVTVDIAGIALKSGNAVLLRGGSAAQDTNHVLVEIIRDALEASGLPRYAVQTVDDGGRPAAQAMMRAVGLIDLLVPRGGHSLIQEVVRNSRVPVVQTGEGNVHLYLHADAPLQRSVDIALNAKVQRPSVCNAAETLLIHADAAETSRAVLQALTAAGVRLHADERAAALVPELSLEPATEEDWATEYGDLQMAVHVVDSLPEALEHIRSYSTGHTEAIITDSIASQQEFIRGVDSAAVMINASTRFTDGGEFGLGAEVGISTQKMHARGPMGLSELTTTQWIVEGDGHVRS
ncbi:glutamate-5-semialdehyde dehydrogenase [Galactobacter valiniphilus]|uniref:Gamma-glutamyl phosphate reductase n=2 Tax=Galactobacter valiniphilus TaxID=2676122 RepID=A0A399JB32_9MICC|nr:glutamate-5-semialdehyde dehydrogenase [Galactobacter valiniphilus]